MSESLETTDAELVARALAEKDSFEPLYRRYAPSLFAFLKGMNRGDEHAAADALQETFLRAYDALDRFDVSRELGPWLFTIAARTSIQTQKRTKRLRATDPASISEAFASREGSPDAAVAGDEACSSLLEAARARVGSRQIDAFLLSRLDGLSYEEIAGRHACSPATVKRDLQSAQKALAELAAELELVGTNVSRRSRVSASAVVEEALGEEAFERVLRYWRALSATTVKVTATLEELAKDPNPRTFAETWRDVFGSIERVGLHGREKLEDVGRADPANPTRAEIARELDRVGAIQKDRDERRPLAERFARIALAILASTPETAAWVLEHAEARVVDAEKRHATAEEERQRAVAGIATDSASRQRAAERVAVARQPVDLSRRMLATAREEIEKAEQKLGPDATPEQRQQLEAARQMFRETEAIQARAEGNVNALVQLAEGAPLDPEALAQRRRHTAASEATLRQNLEKVRDTRDWLVRERDSHGAGLAAFATADVELVKRHAADLRAIGEPLLVTLFVQIEPRSVP